MVGASLFSSAGIAETYFEEVGINIIAANELVQERASLYQRLYPKSKMIDGNILDNRVFEKLVNNTPNKLDFLIASPPCQGMSVAGKNRSIEQMLNDERNYLVLKLLILSK
jgi:Site-specific DNA methylase